MSGFFHIFKCFNPLPHAEGDGESNNMFFCEKEFQSTPSRRGRLSRPHQFYIITGRFNPLPHAEGDFVFPLVLQFPCVSIHSLTQRETCFGLCNRSGLFRFNPLPHAEGDDRYSRLSDPLLSFNPLPHAEGDMPDMIDLLGKGVSIHSLTQRETRVRATHRKLRKFQSTPSRRGRQQK